MLLDYFRYAINNLRKRKLRSLLTIIGIFIGITAVVALISLGQGMKTSINREFQTLGTNRLIITPGGAFFGPTGGSLFTAELTEDDVDVVNSVVGVEKAVGVVTNMCKVEFNDETEYVEMWGMPIDPDTMKLIKDITFFEVEDGRDFKSSDTYAAIVGNRIAKELFDKEIRAGNELSICGKEFKAIGVQKKTGTEYHNLIIRIPKETARDLFDKKEVVDTIMVKTEENIKPVDVAEEVKRALRKHRNVEEREEDFSVLTAEQVVSGFLTILNVVSVVLVGIAAISLIVGGVGIMNTMYTSVTERRKEIGIMKSIGARNNAILIIFLIESGVLGLVGGVVGVIFGLLLSKIGEFIALYLGATIFESYITPGLIIGALLFSFVVGSVSGVLPAMQAAKLNPVDALRKK